MNYLSGLADAALSAVGVENKALLIAAPGAAVIGLSIGSRTGAAALGIISKSAGIGANSMGLTNLGQSLSSAGDAFGNFATRSFKTELQLTVGLTAIAAAGYGISILTAEPEISNFEKLTNFVGLTSQKQTYWGSLTSAVSSVKGTIVSVAQEQGPKIGETLSKISKPYMFNY